MHELNAHPDNSMRNLGLMVRNDHEESFEDDE